MLPYISFIRDNTNELTPLDDKGSFLYTNLDKLKEGSPSSDENSNLEVMVNYKLIVPSEIIKYIRIVAFAYFHPGFIVGIQRIQLSIIPRIFGPVDR